MIKQLLLVLITILLIVGGTAASRPGNIRIERSITIRATPERIFPLISESRNYGAWSPLEAQDPQVQRGISGPPSGKGAAYEWSGNRKVGAGRMEVLEATPPSHLVAALDISKPFESHHTAEFTLRARGDSTRVTWVVFGTTTFKTKLVQVYYKMDDLLGSRLALGLARVKAAAER